jgi:3-hydroxyacyl-CoA dehydrogenase/enoyl-CoA hydratase/3-hydroxybutyryl-CoA epimerase
VNVLDERRSPTSRPCSARCRRVPICAGVVLVSGKPGSFIAGADLAAIGSITDREQALALIRRAHAAFGRLASLPVPTGRRRSTGVCLGGGAELTLAVRLADRERGAAHPDRVPEVLLGIVPGFGGCVALPRLIGCRPRST